MIEDHERNADADENDSQLVAGPEARAAVETSEELEAAWREWANRAANVDQRTMSLLQTAFQAGFEAGRKR
jgi:hypothetical protein